MKATIVMPLAEQRGGAELMLEQLVERSSAVAWGVVFLEDGPMVNRLQRAGIAASVLPAGRLRDVRLYGSTVFALAKLLRKQGADVVVGWMAKAHLYGGPAAKLARIPALWYQLGMPAPPAMLDRVATVLPAKEVLAVSKATGRAQARVRPSRAIRVVYPGISLDQFDADVLPPTETLRRTLGLPADRRLIGIFGRLQAWKGVHVLIDAMPKVLEYNPDAYCVVVGGTHSLEPNYPDQLREQIRRLGLENHVALKGLQADVPQWMKAVDIVVHASLNEPFGIVLLEAMALGKPMIAGSAGGPAEVVTHGEDGLLVPYGDVGCLSGSLLRLLDDPALAARLGESARHRARDFPIEQSLRALESAVLAAVNGNR
jgi:glycosyltransferase involved in cell wall biosynthesis